MSGPPHLSGLAAGGKREFDLNFTIGNQFLPKFISFKFMLIHRRIYLINRQIACKTKRKKLSIFRNLALLCSVAVLTGCMSREIMNQGQEYATANTNIAKQVITEQDQQRCLAHFKERFGNNRKDALRFSGPLMPFATLTKGVAKQLLVKGENEIASKIVTFYSKAYAKGLAGIPIKKYVICYYKIENNRLVFLTSCHAAKGCPYFFVIPIRAYL